MTPGLRELLHELEGFGKANDATADNRSQKMLNITHDTTSPAGSRPHRAT